MDEPGQRRDIKPGDSGKGLVLQAPPPGALFVGRVWDGDPRRVIARVYRMGDMLVFVPGGE